MRNNFRAHEIPRIPGNQTIGLRLDSGCENRRIACRKNFERFSNLPQCGILNNFKWRE